MMMMLPLLSLAAALVVAGAARADVACEESRAKCLAIARAEARAELAYCEAVRASDVYGCADEIETDLALCDASLAECKTLARNAATECRALAGDDFAACKADAYEWGRISAGFCRACPVQP